jgi:hypothetical protein
VDGANAKVDDAKRQIAAMMAMMFFILAVFELFPFTTIITPEGRGLFLGRLMIERERSERSELA